MFLLRSWIIVSAAIVNPAWKYCASMLIWLYFGDTYLFLIVKDVLAAVSKLDVMLNAWCHLLAILAMPELYYLDHLLSSNWYGVP
jgi:hypothetical protein